MIYHIRGRLSDIIDDSIIVDVQGVGYQLIIPHSSLRSLPEIGSETFFYTHHHIREDQQVLFGFSSVEEKRFFVKLTSVSGVGPKIGIKMMSDLTVEVIGNSILKGDIATLTQVSGVGKKMAERLVIELKDKLDMIPSSAASASSMPFEMEQELNADLSMALRSLGYSKDEIKRGLSKAKDQLSADLSLEQSMKLILKQI